jgi:hypothetical protein
MSNILISTLFLNTTSVSIHMLLHKPGCWHKCSSFSPCWCHPTTGHMFPWFQWTPCRSGASPKETSTRLDKAVNIHNTDIYNLLNLTICTWVLGQFTNALSTALQSIKQQDNSQAYKWEEMGSISYFAWKELEKNQVSQSLDQHSKSVFIRCYYKLLSKNKKKLS